MTFILRWLAVLVLACGFASAAERAYTNVKYGYSTAYPDTWKMQEPDPALVLFVKTVQPGQFASNVNIGAEDLPKATTAKALAHDALAQLKQMAGSVRTLTEGPLDIAGQKGYQTVFSGKMGSIDLIWWQVVVVRANRAYALTFTSHHSQFETDKHAAAQIFSSFTLR